MSKNTLYILHPSIKFLPDAFVWVEEVKSILAKEESWIDWRFESFPYDDKNSFHVQSIFIRVKNKPGPVILFDGVQRKPLELLRKRLLRHAIIISDSITDAATLWQIAEDAKSRFESGEPFIPRNFAIAVLIVRKLKKNNCWAGKEKGYLWQSDLAKGRGIPEELASFLPEVINQLLIHHIVIYKISQGEKKYALNPDIKPEIHRIADEAEFVNVKLYSILMKDKESVPAKILDKET